MDLPWCPKGCDKKMGSHDFFYALCAQNDIIQPGPHFVKCPVCNNPIKVFTELVPEYDCWKGEGWSA